MADNGETLNSQLKKKGETVMLYIFPLAVSPEPGQIFSLRSRPSSVRQTAK